MIKYTILEDASPYYIRYTFDGIDNLINLCSIYAKAHKDYNIRFKHRKLEEAQTLKVLDLIPANKQMPLMKDRVSFFITEPGFYYGPHKDGLCHRFSLNFVVNVSDNKCVTSWYSDDDLKHYSISNDYSPSTNRQLPVSSREILHWRKNQHIPIKSMVAKQNEAILFNTDIFHDFDNGNSTNRRVVLTLRHADPAKVYFNDARKIMFGY